MNEMEQIENNGKKENTKLANIPSVFWCVLCRKPFYWPGYPVA